MYVWCKQDWTNTWVEQDELNQLEELIDTEETEHDLNQLSDIQSMMDQAGVDGNRPNLSDGSDITFSAQNHEDLDPFSLSKFPVTRSQTRNLRKAILNFVYSNNKPIRKSSNQANQDV